MNRTIKFRGKSTADGQWRYGYFYKDLGINYIHEFESPNGVFPSHPVHPPTVGQSTGLLDRNGVEIFEGDIVHRFLRGSSGFSKHCNETKTISMVCFVEWDEFRWIIRHRDEDFKCSLDISILELEVIGNIHQNLELLNQQAESKTTFHHPV